MNLLLQLLILQVVVCYIVDLSGAPENLFKPLLRRIFHIPVTSQVKLPLVGCSLCLGLWTNLIYTIVGGTFSLPVLFIIVMLSFFSKNISGLLQWVSDLLSTIEMLLHKLINKLN